MRPRARRRNYPYQVGFTYERSQRPLLRRDGGIGAITNLRGAVRVDVMPSPRCEIAFPKVPKGWYYICQSSAMTHGPVGYEVGRSKYVAFRDVSSRARVLDACCSHMGADLAKGRVVD